MASGEELDKWVSMTKACQYLPENDLKVRINIIKCCKIIKDFENYCSITWCPKYQVF